MSVQFGRWNWEGQPPARDYIDKVNATLAPYGPDSNETYSNGEVTMLYRAFHTTKESRRETQPHVSSSGAVITWDGRLDNHAELISELRGAIATDATDIVIVAAAYEKWGVNCFGKLIGDWALSIWNRIHRSLILAKDPIGTRHLFYSIDKNQITWSSILDPLVLFANKTFAICEEYVAGWFATMCPAAHLTPYVGIHSVPPSSSVLLRSGKQTVSKYWDFDPAQKVRYRTDAEYEEHFRSVFAKAVQRRLRSDRPVLAELSGGMDSSSIVCMADIVMAQGAAETPGLETISWYDSSRTSWDDYLYFPKVEEKRGRTGYHLDLNGQRDFDFQKLLKFNFETDHFLVAPSARIHNAKLFKQYAAYMMSHEYRVVLSGIGGDQVTGGGVPTPKPELQNLLIRARFFNLARQLSAWAIKMRRPPFPLLWEAAQGFFPLALLRGPKNMSLIPWLHPGFVRRNRAALSGYPSRVKLFGPLPSFQDNLNKLDGARRVLTHAGFWSEMFREARYPYLDRGFLEFMYAIPQEQIVRVGQRRSLMKRALVGIIPHEVLNRKQRATVPQEVRKDISTESASLTEVDQHLVSGSIGVIDPNRFLEALQRTRRNQELPTWRLLRTLEFESWLRHLNIERVLTPSVVTKRQDYTTSLESKEVQASAQSKSSAG